MEGGVFSSIDEIWKEVYGEGGDSVLVEGTNMVGIDVREYGESLEAKRGGSENPFTLISYTMDYQKCNACYIV